MVLERQHETLDLDCCQRESNLGDTEFLRWDVHVKQPHALQQHEVPLETPRDFHVHVPPRALYAHVVNRPHNTERRSTLVATVLGE